MGRVVTLSQPVLRALRTLNGEQRSTRLQTEGRCVSLLPVCRVCGL